MSVKVNSSWAQSTELRPIALYQSAPVLQNPILIIGGVHGDEPEGVILAEEALQWLKSNSSAVSPNENSWMLIPCLNPDGYVKGERTNGRGVDLNRNYPSRDWSPAYTKDRYHPGAHPGSEPEIQALVQLIGAAKPYLIIHCHSWKPCIVYAGAPAKSAAESLGRASGYNVLDDIGYPTPGSLSRYGWFDNQIPIICIEEEERTPPEKIWSHFASGFHEIFNGSQKNSIKEAR